METAAARPFLGHVRSHGHVLYLRPFCSCWQGCEVMGEGSRALPFTQGQGHKSPEPLCAGEQKVKDAETVTSAFLGEKTGE